MQIVAYTNSYLPDCRAGAQTMLRDLLRPLRGDHQLCIVVHDGMGRTEPYTWEGITVYPNAEQAVQLEQIRRADLIITHLQATEAASWLADRNDIPVIQLMHDEDRCAHEYLQHRWDTIVFNSHWVRDAFTEYAGPAMVLYPPVRAQEYRTTPGDAVTLVNLSGLEGSAVFYRLAERFEMVPFLGVRGGYGEQDIRRLPNVTIVDPVDDMREVYRRTRVVLMPSDYESFGRCAIEAAASGIPTIAAPTPGLRESLGTAGTFCTTKDLPGWQAELARLLTDEGWDAASKRARDRSTELSTLAGRQVGDWVRLIESFEPAWARI